MYLFHPEDNSTMIRQEPEKNPEDMKRLAVVKATVRDHQLKLT